MRLFVLIIAAWMGASAHAQALTASAPSSSVKPAKPAVAHKVAGSAWADLTPDQQTALAPLQAEWSKINETQKRKWLELSKNFGKLQPDEQAKVHSRMKDWVALSPQQRAQARLNFSAAKTLSPEEKQKQWQAYQALSPADKQQLAAKAKDNTPNSAALANKSQNKTLPVSKLQTLPASTPSAPAATPSK
jgi:ADP-heptose:LPS heptosyltransferase